MKGPNTKSTDRHQKCIQPSSKTGAEKKKLNGKPTDIKNQSCKGNHMLVNQSYKDKHLRNW